MGFWQRIFGLLPSDESEAPLRPLESILVVGLGNPGPEYEGTRHNVGFVVVQAVAKRLGCVFRTERGPLAVARGECSGRAFSLVMPLGFMNRSGECLVQRDPALSARPDGILVVVDDINLPLGTLRFRERGSDGGHNGLRSLIACLGSEAFPRLRIGVGAPPPGGMIEWVLGRFDEQQLLDLAPGIESAVESVLAFLGEGVAAAAKSVHHHPSLPADVRGTERAQDAGRPAAPDPTARGGGDRGTGS